MQVQRTTSLSNAHCELSVALVRCAGAVYRSCANLLARAVGCEILLGLR